MQDQHEYSTSDLNSAVYLLAIGEPLLRMDYRDPKRVAFCFRDIPTVHKAVEDFWNGKARIEPLHLLQTQKLLKQRIYAYKS